LDTSGLIRLQLAYSFFYYLKFVSPLAYFYLRFRPS